MSASQIIERLFIESDMDAIEHLSLDHGQIVALCRRCPGKTEPNDDSAAVVQLSNGAIVIAVADGAGGCPLGYKASATAVGSIVQCLREHQPGNDLRPFILDGIEKANQGVLSLGAGAATTLTVVEIHEGNARGYQVGDSVALIVGQRGALKWRSMSHSPVGYAIESGLLNEEDAMHNDERHVVSNLVGSRSMHIEIGPTQPLAVHDTIIVASDGLSDNLQLAEMIELGRAGALPTRLKRMRELAEKRMSETEQDQIGKPDDLTVLMFTR